MRRLGTAAAVAAALGSGVGAGGQETAGATGEALVQRTCTPCHVLPPPDVLPRRSWRSVVVDMTGLLIQGIGLPPSQPRPSSDYDIYQVFDYFESRAPEALPSPSPWPSPGAERFVRHALAFAGAPAPPAVANVRFLALEPGAPPQAVAADMLAGLVLAGDPRRPSDGMRLLGRVPHPCHLEAVDLDRDGLLDLVAADLGVAKPSDELVGTVTWLRRLPAGTYQAIPLATGLPRVADVQAADFDGDGDHDLVVAAFGWRKVGAILLLENRTPQGGAAVFVKRELDGRPGAIHVPVADLDRDGRADFVALLSQQHEMVVAFLGDGKGGFRQEVVDRAPHPAWGSSGLQLVDLDRDGDLDVLVTNGDMLDDYQLKPYHGIRWLENKGAFPFLPHELAPLFGVMRALAADLDGDGDQDVVACALVQLAPESGPPAASPSTPSLVWLEQTAPGRFARHTLETGRQHLALDLADYDGDGDVDIAVANSLAGGASFVELWENVQTGATSKR